MDAAPVVLNTTIQSKAEIPFISRGYVFAFGLVTSLFFMWAIANNLNDVLIRHFQKALDLTRGQSGLIQFIFYLGYFTMALPAGFLMNKYGYKKGILVGLALYASGAALFYPAAEVREYGVFLAALFIIASGLTFLETAANPYVTVLGDKQTAAQRLNFAQSFNGLGATIAPILGGIFIFTGVELSTEQLAQLTPNQMEAYRISEAQSVQMPYLVLSAVVLVIFTMVLFTRLPEIEEEDDRTSHGQRGSILKEKRLIMSVMAQFFYVGAQVGIWSYFIDFTKDLTPDVSEKTAAFYLSASLFLFMVGRFAGTAAMSRVQPELLLKYFAMANVALCLSAITTSGMFAVASLLLTSMFMSIMFPTIFALGVQGLGASAKLGSSLIIMAIIGGALIPPAMGYIADFTSNIQFSILLPLLCFAFVLLYALWIERDQDGPINSQA